MGTRHLKGEGYGLLKSQSRAVEKTNGFYHSFVLNPADTTSHHWDNKSLQTWALESGEKSPSTNFPDFFPSLLESSGLANMPLSLFGVITSCTPLSASTSAFAIHPGLSVKPCATTTNSLRQQERSSLWIRH